MATAKLRNQIISTEEAAQLAGHQRAWVHHSLVDTGLLKRQARGQFKLGEFVLAVVEHYKSLIVKEKARAGGQLDRIKALKASRHLVAVDEVMQMLQRDMGALRADLEGVVPLVTRDLELRQRIADAQHDCFRRFWAAIEKGFAYEPDDLDDAA